MSNILENAFLLGLGALSLSKNAATALVREAVKKAEISENDGASLLKTFTDEGQKAKDALEAAVQEAISRHCPNQGNQSAKIEELEKRVADLEAKLAACQADKDNQ